jgi:ubiquinol-cytochrome c reductase cytochrome b subunit
MVVLLLLAFWLALGRRVTGDRAVHNVLDRPREAPTRTAFGAAFFTWVFLVFFAGAADRVYLFLGWSYQVQIWVYRIGAWVLPLVVFFVTRKVCRELLESERIQADREAAEAEASAAPSVAPEPGRAPAR